MRPLLPSLKENKRYILFKIHSEIEINKTECDKAIQQATLRLLGELGCAKAGITFLKETYREKEKTGIIRVNAKHTDELKMALGTITQISNRPATFDALKASGIIGKLK